VSSFGRVYDAMNLDWTTASHTLIKIFARTTLNLP